MPHKTWNAGLVAPGTWDPHLFHLDSGSLNLQLPLPGTNITILSFFWTEYYLYQDSAKKLRPWKLIQPGSALSPICKHCIPNVSLKHTVTLYCNHPFTSRWIEGKYYPFILESLVLCDTSAHRKKSINVYWQNVILLNGVEKAKMTWEFHIYLYFSRKVL